MTVAGLLMFGKGLPVRERFANFRMDYLDMTNLSSPEERYSDRLTYDGRWENNFYQFFRIVVPKLTFDLPRPFKLEGIQRQDDTPQHKAVREAFTNSIIHSDVFLSGGILRVEKHDDRLVLRNPGTLKLPLSKIIEGGSSKARNPRMQNMLRMIGYGENIGSGFPQILNAWKLAGWKEPVLEDRWDVQEVQLTMFVMKEDVVKRVVKDVAKELTERQRLILSSIRDNATINANDLSQKMGVAPRTIQRELSVLQSAGIIVRRGGRKEGYWELIK